MENAAPGACCENVLPVRRKGVKRQALGTEPSAVSVGVGELAAFHTLQARSCRFRGGVVEDPSNQRRAGIACGLFCLEVELR
eukprot:829136-Rhodomonas_salina.3